MGWRAGRLRRGFLGYLCLVLGELVLTKCLFRSDTHSGAAATVVGGG